jgi:hypothetical protein
LKSYFEQAGLMDRLLRAAAGLLTAFITFLVTVSAAENLFLTTVGYVDEWSVEW